LTYVSFVPNKSAIVSWPKSGHSSAEARFLMTEVRYAMLLRMPHSHILWSTSRALLGLINQMKAVMVNLRCETKGTQERTNLKVIKYKVWKCNRLRSMKGRVIDRCQNKSWYCTVISITVLFTWEQELYSRGPSKLHCDRLCVQSYCIRKHEIGLRFHDTTGHGIRKQFWYWTRTRMLMFYWRVLPEDSSWDSLIIYVV
jgi:hypothetical protein